MCAAWAVYYSAVRYPYERVSRVQIFTIFILNHEKLYEILFGSGIPACCSDLHWCSYRSLLLELIMIVGQAQRDLEDTEKNIDFLLAKVAQLEHALETTTGILTNIRHETDYMPDSYYEWIDKVMNEVDELLPSPPELIWQSSTLQQPDVWTDRTDEEYELMNHLARFNWRQIEK
jgi:hypothetical protein